jgi:adenylate kinase
VKGYEDAGTDIAPPGAGKGTQGALIAAHFGIPHIATGELLRDHVARRTDLGLAVQAYLDRGELVPDQVVLDIAREAWLPPRRREAGMSWTESRGTCSKPARPA